MKQIHRVIANSSKLGVLLSLTLCGPIIDANAQNTVQLASGTAAAQPAAFAKVGGIDISWDEYNAAYNAAVRAQFYHAKPPEGALAALQREVGDKLVTRALLLQEAKRRGLRPDEAELKSTLDSYEQRYAKSEQWKRNREQTLPGLTARLQQESLLAQFEKSIRATPVPTSSQVKSYYSAHPDKFTEPEQLRVSVIMLKVDPSSPKDAWDKAEKEAQEIVKKLREKGDFAALARLHSGDPSAEQGGDMGYLHNGMLPDGAQDLVNPLKIGEFSSPVRLLEGVAIFRVTDRKMSRLNSFDVVQKRAQELLQRELGDQAWSEEIARLKKEIPIQIDQSNYLPLASQASPK